MSGQATALSRAFTATLAAVASPLITWALVATLPSADDIPGLDQLDTRGEVRRLIREAPLLFTVALLGSVLGFVLTPVLTVRWPLPALLLPRAVLDRHAYGMASHRLYLMRQAMLMLKTAGGGIWAAAPEVRARLGLAAYGSDPGTFRGDLQVTPDLAADAATGAP